MKIQWLYNSVQTSSYIQEQEGQISSGVKKKTSLDRWQKDSFVAEWLEEKSIEMERNSSADPKQVTSSVKHGRDHVILQACMADSGHQCLMALSPKQVMQYYNNQILNVWLKMLVFRDKIKNIPLLYKYSWTYL